MEEWPPSKQSSVGRGPAAGLKAVPCRKPAVQLCKPLFSLAVAPATHLRSAKSPPPHPNLAYFYH